MFTSHIKFLVSKQDECSCNGTALCSNWGQCSVCCYHDIHLRSGNNNNLGNLFHLCNVFIVSLHAHVLCTIDSFHPINRKRCQVYFNDWPRYSTCLAGLVGASVKQKLVQNVPRCSQTARSLLQLHRRDPSNWLTYQHLNFLKRQVSSSHCFSLASITAERYLDLLVDAFSLLYLKGE